jgi:hypothetical protein
MKPSTLVPINTDAIIVGDLMWPANASFCCERADTDASDPNFHSPLGGSKLR